VVIRGDAALPVVRVDRLMEGAAEAGAGQAPGPNGPLIVVTRKAGLMAFQVDEITGIAPRSAGVPALELDALLAKLPDAGTPLPVPAAAAGAARTDQARAYLSFMLAGQPCLLPMRVIRAVADHVRPATLPRTARDGAATLVGLRAIRGQILPVFDLRGALGLPRDQVAIADIVVAADGLPSFVVPAQLVDGVVRLADDMVHETGRRAIIGGVVQLGGRLTWVLTPAALAPSVQDAAQDIAKDIAQDTGEDIARGAARGAA
jgi:chemotaxis signal transduction protein